MAESIFKQKFENVAKAISSNEKSKNRNQKVLANRVMEICKELDKAFADFKTRKGIA